MLKGIDVSTYQTIEFNLLSVDFIVIKATEGVGFTDPKFVTHQREAREKGLLIGYYHFARPDLGNSAESEADYFIKVCNPKQGEILFLDFEVQYANKVVWCKTFLDRIFLTLKNKPVIYLNKSLASGNDWSSVINAGYGLWLADYTYNPDSPIPSTKWPVMAFRQYSNKLVTPGIGGVVDANVFYGDKEAFMKYGVDFTSGSATGTTETEKLEQQINDMRISRDRWKKDYKDLEALYTTLKKDSDTNKTALDQALKNIDKLKTVIQENKTPLSFYTWTERFKSLFS